MGEGVTLQVWSSNIQVNMVCAIDIFSHEQPYKCAIHIQLSLPQTSAADVMSDSGKCCIHMHSLETGQRILTA